MRLAVLAACAAGFLTLTASAAADHATRPHKGRASAPGQAKAKGKPAK